MSFKEVCFVELTPYDIMFIDISSNVIRSILFYEILKFMVETKNCASLKTIFPIE